MLVQAYLSFDGRCEEALEFYKRALGAEVQMMMRFKDAPQAPAPGMVPPGSENKVQSKSNPCEMPAVMNNSLPVGIGSPWRASQSASGSISDAGPPARP